MLTVTSVKENEEKLAVLIARYNLLGSILYLPSVVADAKKAVEDNEAYFKKAKKDQED